MRQAENEVEQQTGLKEASQYDKKIVMIVCRRFEEVNKLISTEADVGRKSRKM